MKTKLIARLTYNDIFTQRRNIESLKKEIDINDSLLILSTINKFEYKLREKDNSEIIFIISEWLLDVSHELQNKIIEAYAKHSEKEFNKKQITLNLKTVSLINRISTLRVIEILCSQRTNHNDKKIVEKRKSRENLLRLYLLINDEIANRQQKVFHKFFKDNPDHKDEVYLHLFFGIAQPLPHYSKAHSLQSEIYKFLIFEKWFRNNESYSHFFNGYVQKIGLDNWQQYFNCILELCRVAKNSNVISIKNHPFLLILAKHFGIQATNSYGWSEFVYLKKNPLIELENERYLVLDFEFLLNKLFSSLYHDLISLSKQQGLNNFAQDYVREFVEGCLLKDAFQTSYGSSYIQYCEKDIKIKGDKNIENLGLPDYYLRNGNNVMLIEFKNSYLSNVNKIDLNFEKLLRELKDKFYYTQQNNSDKRRPKAVLQLINYIINSIDGKYNFFDRTKKPENLTYYPILLVLDSTLTGFGFNQLLNNYFKKELENSIIITKYKVKSLTIIHIDDFFIHQDRLKKLTDLIKSYHKFIGNNVSFDSMFSFSDYLRVVKFKIPLKPKRKSVQHIIHNSLLPQD